MYTPATSVPTASQQTFFQWGTPDNPNPCLAAPVGANATTYTFTAPPLDHTGAVVSKDFIMGVRDSVTGYVTHVYVPASGLSADGLTATNCVSGLRLEGLDWTTGDTTLAPAISQDSPVFCVVSPVERAITQAALTAQIGANIKFNGRPLFTGVGVAACPVFADAAARDAAITAPQNGDMCYVTADGVFYDYQGGNWQSRANGAVVNATTDAAGKVRISAQATFDAGLATNGGDPVVADPSIVQAGIQKGSQLYCVASGTANAITVAYTPTITAYATGMQLRFKATASNTGATTINVDGLGAKTIKKNANTDLVGGEIVTGQQYDVRYDGTNFIILNPTTNAGSVGLVAGENLTAGDAVYISDGTENDELMLAYAGANALTFNNTNYWFSTFFTSSSSNTKLKKVIIYTRGVVTGGGSGTEQWTLSLRAVSGGKPTGADLASASASNGGNSQNTTAVLFDFADAAISPNTQYALVLRCNAANTIVYYGGGSPSGATSTDAGVTWSTTSTGFAYRVQLGITTTVGSVYKASASKYDVRNKVTGFAIGTVTAGNTVNVQTIGIIGLAGLTPGATYYLSDTAGQLSLTAGTVPRKLGTAFTATLFNFNPEQRKFIPGTGVSISSSGGDNGTVKVDLVNMYSGRGFNRAAKSVLVQVATVSSPTNVVPLSGANGSYTAASGIAGQTVELELFAGELFSFNCSGFVSFAPFIVTGCYI